MEVIKTNDAPQAIGPYSQAIKANGFLFCSGQIALNPDGDLVEGDSTAQAEQIMKNIEGVLSAAGSNFGKVVKTTIFLTNMDDYAAVNEVYSKYFSENKPARSAVAVASLPKGVSVEIECIAIA